MSDTCVESVAGTVICYDAECVSCKDLVSKLMQLADLNKSLREEVARLKPPEPKFKVGQIVCRRGLAYGPHYFRITHTEYVAGPRQPRYKDSQDYWHDEEELRALTREEKDG